ncbi:MAG: protein phosphatase 2C domain-containing protein [Chloroflexi bacterium]|nr:protein phosphatase 2C domain-containing protein [Chloroflexota bacterium]
MPGVGYLSDQGKQRTDNQDNAYFPAGIQPQQIAQQGALFIVADGVGGNAGGELASRMTVELIPQAYYADATPDPAQRLRAAIQRANTAIYTQAKSGDVRTEKMSATVVCAVTLGGYLYVAHAGDSRAYLLHRNGAVERLTTDHKWVYDQVRIGALTLAEAEKSDKRNIITRSVGGEASLEPELSVAPRALQPGDRLLLCTDGLSDLASDAELARMARQAALNTGAQQMINLANKRGGPDNITVLLVELDTFGPARAPGGAAAGRAGGRKPLTGNMPLIAGVVVALLVIGIFALAGGPPPPPPTPAPVPTVTHAVTAVAGPSATPSETRAPTATPTLAPTAATGPSRGSASPTPTNTPAPATVVPQLAPTVATRYAGITLADPPDKSTKPVEQGFALLFDWSYPPKELASGDHFVVQIARPGTNEWSDVECTMTGDTPQHQCNADPAKLGGTRDYRWRVMVRDNAGKLASAVGNEWTFMLKLFKIVSVCVKRNPVSGECITEADQEVDVP